MFWIELWAMIQVALLFIPLVIVAVTFTIIIFLALKEYIIQSMCKHDAGVNETMACDAICRKCGKNLGFIGTWREKQKDL